MNIVWGHLSQVGVVHGAGVGCRIFSSGIQRDNANRGTSRERTRGSNKNTRHQKKSQSDRSAPWEGGG